MSARLGRAVAAAVVQLAEPVALSVEAWSEPVALPCPAGALALDTLWVRLSGVDGVSAVRVQLCEGDAGELVTVPHVEDVSVAVGHASIATRGVAVLHVGVVVPPALDDARSVRVRLVDGAADLVGVALTWGA